MDRYSPLEIGAWVVLFLVAGGLGYLATLCAAFVRGRKACEADLVDAAIEDPVAYERWLAEQKIARLEAERAAREMWGVDQF